MCRVVVTGIGIISPVGKNREETWNSLLEGRNGVSFIESFDPEHFKTKIAAEIKDFNPEDHGIEKKQIRRLDRFQQFAIAASGEAMKDSGMKETDYDPYRSGVSIGVGFGGLHTFETEHKKFVENPEKAPRRISPFSIPMMIANLGSGLVSIEHNMKGPQHCPVAACASGTYGVIEGFRTIKEGLADVMITGGAEAAISPIGTGGFMTMKALSKRNDAPEKASRPFDRDRDGFVPGEGAGILILEELEHAKKRGAKIYCEMTGFGASSDAHHITQPSPGGEGAVRAMKNAIESAGISPEKINYINAHGTSTPFNDKSESQAIRTVFGKHTDSIAVNATKSMVGHLLGAAGGLEAAVTALSIKNSVIHKTRNLENPGEGCDLDFVPEGKRNLSIRAALCNSFGFGGVNGVIVFESYNGE